MSQDLAPDITALLDRLYVDLKHDAKASGLIGQLATHLKTYNETEAAIEKKVAPAYDFEKAQIDEREPSSFIDFVVSTAARVGLCFHIAREVNLTDEQIDYLRQRLTDAQMGAYVAAAAGITILSNSEIRARAFDTALADSVGLAQRVLNVETPKAKFRPDQIKKVLENKRIELAKAEALIDAYDPSVEDLFQRNAEVLLEEASSRLEKFERTGVQDPKVVINRMFTHYEDQLFFEIGTLKTQMDLGSKELQVVERAAVTVTALRAEIDELERALEPIARSQTIV